MLIAFERILIQHGPAMIVVAGDVNSTLACALAASKLQIPVVHLESGSGPATGPCPEEINRVLTDRVSDLLLTHSPKAEENLPREGVDPDRMRNVGKTMIDSLSRFEGRARERARGHRRFRRAGRLIDVRRAMERSRARSCAAALIVFPVHPRTRARLGAGSLLERLEAAGVRCIEPVGYLGFLSLEAAAGTIVTDSGGVQEEASALGRGLLHAPREHRAPG